MPQYRRLEQTMVRRAIAAKQHEDRARRTIAAKQAQVNLVSIYETTPIGTLVRQLEQEFDKATKRAEFFRKELAKLVGACTSRGPSGVTCPDRRMLARSRRISRPFPGPALY